MSPSRTHRPKEEIPRLGEEVFERLVRPKVSSEDEYRFLAIDIDTGDFEVDDDDYTAVTRPSSRETPKPKSGSAGSATPGLSK